MEARKITVVQTKNQKKSVVMTNAETLGQLKEALKEKNIDYDGMTFYEGLSKTELKHDDSILPHDIERNGTVTNELVFMLTNTDKKIKSGAMSRPELYDYIKKNSLQSEVQKELGKNFTMCKTADLQDVVDKHKKGNNSKPVAEEKPVVREKPVAEANPEPKVEVKAEASVTVQDNGNIKKAFEALLENLYENDYIDTSVKDEILDILNGGSEPTSNTTSPVVDDMSSPYSDAEIAAMMRNM